MPTAVWNDPGYDWDDTRVLWDGTASGETVGAPYIAWGIGTPNLLIGHDVYAVVPATYTTWAAATPAAHLSSRIDVTAPGWVLYGGNVHIGTTASPAPIRRQVSTGPVARVVNRRGIISHGASIQRSPINRAVTQRSPIRK